MDLKKLADVMDYKLRKWPWGKQLAYISARQAQDRLDKVCWPENWKVEYKEIKWELFAWVSIKVPSRFKDTGDGMLMTVDYEWITKWDWGTESNIEKEKGLISDSFKRACVTWGIGRFLYSLWDTKKPTKKPRAELWLDEYITMAQDEEDSNHLDVLWKEFDLYSWTKAQQDYMIDVCKQQKEKLLKWK